MRRRRFARSGHDAKIVAARGGEVLGKLVANSWLARGVVGPRLEWILARRSMATRFALLCMVGSAGRCRRQPNLLEVHDAGTHVVPRCRA